MKRWDKRVHNEHGKENGDKYITEFLGDDLSGLKYACFTHENHIWDFHFIGKSLSKGIKRWPKISRENNSLA